MAGATIHPSELSTEPLQDAPLADAPKRKRKWGQPIGEIKQVLPPRKRAKTAEEKEQRAKERIQRNRDAAEASRKRKNEQHRSLKDQRDSLQSIVTQLISRLTDLGDNSVLPTQETLEYLMSKPERDLMSANERKRAAEVENEDSDPVIQQDAPTKYQETKATREYRAAQATLPSPVSSPTSQFSHHINSSPETNAHNEFTPATVYHSDFDEESTESARGTLLHKAVQAATNNNIANKRTLHLNEPSTTQLALPDFVLNTTPEQSTLAFFASPVQSESLVPSLDYSDSLLVSSAPSLDSPFTANTSPSITSIDFFNIDTITDLDQQLELDRFGMSLHTTDDSSLTKDQAYAAGEDFTLFD